MLARFLRPYFDAGDRRRGEGYFRERRVVELAGSTTGIVGTVRGSERYRASVMVRQTPPGIGFSCTCPRFADAESCKHLWALVLQADLTRLSSKLELPWGQPWGSSSPISSAPPDSPASAPQPVEAPEPPWQSSLDRVASRIQQATASRQGAAAGRPGLRTRLELQTSRKLCGRHGGLVVQCTWRGAEGGDRWGPAHPARVSYENLEPFTEETDRELLRALLLAARDPKERESAWPSWDRRAYAAFTILPPLYPTLLPALCASGRLTWADRKEQPIPITTFEPEPWRFELVVVRATGDSEQSPYRITGRLVRGDQARDPRELITLAHQSLVLSGGTLAPLRLEPADLAWLEETQRHQGALDIPGDAASHFLERLWSLPASPRVDLPPELRVEDVVVQPEPRLVLRSMQPGWMDSGYPSLGRAMTGLLELELRLELAYPDGTIDPSWPESGWLDLERRQRRQRDRDAEHAHRETLRAIPRLRAVLDQPPYHAGGVPAPRTSGRLLVGAQHIGDLLHELASSLPPPWRVLYEGRPLRTASAPHFELRTSDIDWFELDGRVDFGDGETLALPQLLEALTEERATIELPGGGIGVVPDDWRAALRALGALRGRDAGGALRYRPAQVLLVDAILGERLGVETDFDASAERLRSTLRDFTGVAPRDPPPSFRGELRRYQGLGLGWLWFLREIGLGGCLADDMGLGKTVQVLALLAELASARREQAAPPSGNGKGGRRGGKCATARSANDTASSTDLSIVVAPKSVVGNWAAEARRFAPELRVVEHVGTQRSLAADDLAGCDLLVTSYGVLLRDVGELARLRCDVLVLDEAQAIKNPRSKTARAVRALDARQRLALTGTPVENHLGELASILDFLNPGMLGALPSLRALADGKGAAESDLGLAARALRPLILRRTKDQVLADLPRRTQQTLTCELSPAERKRYDELLRHYRESLRGRIAQVGLRRAKIHVLEALLRLRQAACHQGLIDPKLAGEPSAKLHTLLEQLEVVLDGEHKALVFSQFTSFLALVRAQLDHRRLSYEYLDGKTRDRDRRIARFQGDPDCRLFLISLKAGGLGLNLTAADYVFLLDPWWNPAVEAQAIDRAHRIGQTRPVFAYRLIARDTVEERIAELQDSKRQLAEAILGEDKSLIEKLTPEDLERLLA